MMLNRYTEVIHTSSNELRVCCPWCNDTKYHAWVNPDKQVFICFRCNESGTIAQLISKLSGKPVRDVHKLLKAKPKPERLVSEFSESINRLRGITATPQVEDISMPKGYVLFQKKSQPSDIIGRLALDYLIRKRKFTMDTILYFALGYGTAYPFLGRVVIPVERGFWQARTITGGDTRKYLNPEGSKGNVLFNPTAVALDTVFICEGAFSAMRLGRNAIGLLGKRATAHQLERLADSDVSTFHVHLDADATRYAYDLAWDLHLRGKDVWVQEYTSGDPDAGTRGELVHIDKLTVARKRLQFNT